MTDSQSLHPSIAARLQSLQLGEPHVHNSFGLWPVFAPEIPDPAYISLVDALALPGFQVTEVSEGGSVPNLRVINETEHHVLLFDGEELKGAKQNRILNTTILVEAGSSLDVPVSCTEQGRWNYNSAHFSVSGSLAYAELRKRKSAAVAESLHFMKAHLSNQGEVWSEIEQLHHAAKTSDESHTRAMRDAYEKSQRDIDGFARGIELQDGQCGLLAVIGDRVEGVDVLSRPDAYGKLHRRLVESHAMDFLVRKGRKSRKPLDPGAPARFLAEAATATESTHDTPGFGIDHRLQFRWGHGAALRVDETIVHLALFGGIRPGDGKHPMEPRLIRRRRNA